MLCVSCSESYITYLLLLMWWCLRPLFTALHFLILLSGLLFGIIPFPLLPQLFFPPVSALLQLYVTIIKDITVYRQPAAPQHG